MIFDAMLTYVILTLPLLFAAIAAGILEAIDARRGK